MSSRSSSCPALLSVSFFNDTATNEIYTLSLHDALPISVGEYRRPRRIHHLLAGRDVRLVEPDQLVRGAPLGDRKSTRLNSSHANISYAVFCLKTIKELLHWV